MQKEGDEENEAGGKRSGGKTVSREGTGGTEEVKGREVELSGTFIRKQKKPTQKNRPQPSERGRELLHGATSTEGLNNDGKGLLTNNALAHQNLDAKLVIIIIKGKEYLDNLCN